jgi:hypothetical protein
MSKLEYYIGFPSAENLSIYASNLLYQSSTDSPSKYSKLLSQTLCSLTDEIANAYLIDIFKRSNPSAAQAKALEVAELGIRATSHTLIKRISKNLSPEQQAVISEHLKSIILPIEMSSLQEINYVAFQIDSDFYKKITESYNNINIDAINFNVSV